LQLQWQSELKSKFNEDFEILDGAALQYLGRGKANPWMTRQNVICSLPFASSPKRAEQIIEAEWDLVIFDEAHRVRRSLQGATKTRTTQAYGLADELKELVNGLLLTATPMPRRKRPPGHGHLPEYRGQPALSRRRHGNHPHPPGHRTRPDPHAQLPTAMRPASQTTLPTPWVISSSIAPRARSRPTRPYRARPRARIRLVGRRPGCRRPPFSRRQRLTAGDNPPQVIPECQQVAAVRADHHDHNQLLVIGAGDNRVIIAIEVL
jgi:hypothetical protein